MREEFDDWAILFNPDDGRGFGLSPTGVYLWKLLDGEHTIEALFDEFRNHAENVPDGIEVQVAPSSMPSLRTDSPCTTRPPNLNIFPTLPHLLRGMRLHDAAHDLPCSYF